MNNLQTMEVYKDRDEAVNALNFALEYFGKEDFLFTLYNIAIVQGPSHVAERAGLTRESLYKALQPCGNPRFDTLLRILKALDLQLQVRENLGVLKSSCSHQHVEIKKITRKNSLFVAYPELAKQWHPHKNGNLTADDIIPTSRKKVWWQCPSSHEWEAPACSIIKNFKVNFLSKNCTQESFSEFMSKVTCPQCNVYQWNDSETKA